MRSFYETRLFMRANKRMVEIEFQEDENDSDGSDAAAAQANDIQVVFVLRTSMKLKRMFHVFADRVGVPVASLRFTLDGDEVSGEDTASELHLQNLETIQCHWKPIALWVVDGKQLTEMVVKPSMMLQRFFDAYEKRAGRAISVTKREFYFQGKSLKGDHKIHDVALRDQDVILCKSM